MMAGDVTVINLRLPETLNEKLNDASSKAGVPKNCLVNDAVAVAIDGNKVGAQAKEEYVHTCVRLPDAVHAEVRSMAYGRYISINAMLVQILAKHLGVEPWDAAAEEDL